MEFLRTLPLFALLAVVLSFGAVVYSQVYYEAMIGPSIYFGATFLLGLSVACYEFICERGCRSEDGAVSPCADICDVSALSGWIDDAYGQDQAKHIVQNKLLCLKRFLLCVLRLTAIVASYPILGWPFLVLNFAVCEGTQMNSNCMASHRFTIAFILFGLFTLAWLIVGTRCGNDIKHLYKCNKAIWTFPQAPWKAEAEHDVMEPKETPVEAIGVPRPESDETDSK